MSILDWLRRKPQAERPISVIFADIKEGDVLRYTLKSTYRTAITVRIHFGGEWTGWQEVTLNAMETKEFTVPSKAFGVILTCEVMGKA